MINKKVQWLIPYGFHRTRKRLLLNEVRFICEEKGIPFKLIEGKYRGISLVHAMIGYPESASDLELLYYNQYDVPQFLSVFHHKNQLIAIDLLIHLVRILIGSVSIYLMISQMSQPIIFSVSVILFTVAILLEKILKYMLLKRSSAKISDKIIRAIDLVIIQPKRSIILADSGMGIALGKRHLTQMFPKRVIDFDRKND